MEPVLAKLFVRREKMKIKNDKKVFDWWSVLPTLN